MHTTHGTEYATLRDLALQLSHSPAEAIGISRRARFMSHLVRAMHLSPSTERAKRASYLLLARAYASAARALATERR